MMPRAPKPIDPAAALRKATAAANAAKLSAPLLLQIRMAQLDEGMSLEHVFHPTRKWRLDIAWPHKRLYVEIEGGVWTAGRHGRGAGIVADMEKQNAAVVLGWKPLRVAVNHITSGEAITWIRQALTT
jgi:hypothetical protein